MKTYSVKEIAELLNTNPETVRRWIRDNKLKATKNSNKEGSVISEAELKKFLKNTPKYYGVAAAGGMIGVGAPITGIAVAAVSEIVSSIIRKSVESSEVTIKYDDMIVMMDEEIAKHRAEIHRKRQSIKSIEREILEEEKKINQIISTKEMLNAQVKETLEKKNKD
jgi:excisionase family DNA binding protein